MLLGNITRAAEYLQISQPAVSRLMGELQKTTEMVLFKRTRQGMVPTADAEAVFEEVKSMFSGLEELTRRAHGIRDLEQGELRIGTISLYGNGILPLLISDFIKVHPNIPVIIESDLHRRVIDRVHSRRFEIGFVSLPVSDPDLDIEFLASQPAVCAIPANHPLAEKQSIAPQDLAGIPFISFPKETSNRFQVDSLFDRLGILRDMKIEAGTHESVVGFVAAGIGVAIISPYTPHLIKDASVALRPFQPSLPREIGMLTKYDMLSPKARTFFDFVKARFADPEFDYTL